jgi:hypothetical protein
VRTASSFACPFRTGLVIKARIRISDSPDVRSPFRINAAAADPDNPEWTADDFKRAKPFAQVFPELAGDGVHTMELLASDVAAVIKVLGDGELKSALTVRAHRFSKSAQEKIAKAGGKVGVATDANKPRPADCAWVKRYDFHATESSDVMYAASEQGWQDALRRFATRGIPFVIAQEHVPGDLVKFYGVRNAASSESTLNVGAFWCDKRNTRAPLISRLVTPSS